MKLRLVVEVEYDADEMHDRGKHDEFVSWLSGPDAQLLLHSNDMGDVIGEVTVLKVEAPF